MRCSFRDVDYVLFLDINVKFPKSEQNSNIRNSHEDQSLKVVNCVSPPTRVHLEMSSAVIIDLWECQIIARPPRQLGDVYINNLKSALRFKSRC